MKVLAFDTATTTGWALVEDGTVIESGTRSFPKSRGESNGIVFLRFRSWLAEVTGLTSPDVIVYELAHYRGGAATELCVGLQTRVMEVAEALSLPYAGYHTGTLKKWATGSGRGNKDDMLRAAAERGYPVEDDNEADAILLGLMASEKLG